MPLALPAADDGAMPIQTVAPPFKTLRIIGDAVVISDEGRLGRINSSGPDVVTNWTTTLTFRVGETVRQQGPQANLYWEVLAITNGMVKMHYFGGGGKGFHADEMVWMRESNTPKPPPLVLQGSNPPSFLTKEARAGMTYEVGVYVVKQGDNLVSIAFRHDLTVRALADLNPELKGKPLAVGQQIRVFERPRN